MNSLELKDRTKAFAVRVIRLTEALPKSQTGFVIGRQLLRSGTSVAANYRAACRGKSKRDFVHKLCMVEEELDECVLWMELLVESRIVSQRRLAALTREADELLAIVVAGIRTARGGRR